MERIDMKRVRKLGKDKDIRSEPEHSPLMKDLARMLVFAIIGAITFGALTFIQSLGH